MKRKLEASPRYETGSSTSFASQSSDPSRTPPNQASKQAQKKQKNIATEDVPWPGYFHSLLKTFKAINTVLAFVSSKKHLAVTFPSIRSSVEAQLKHPLEISTIAELKALLPDLITFSYIPRSEIQLNEKVKNSSFDYSQELSSNERLEGHVLILEFADHLKGKKTRNLGFAYNHPPTLTTAALQKLIERRNDACKEALNNLLQTCQGDDPVDLLKDAGRNHIPLPSVMATSHKVENLGVPIPEPGERPAIGEIIKELVGQTWYKDQIVHRQTYEAKAAQTGSLRPHPSNTILQALYDTRKINSLYTHQVNAIEAIRSGRNVIVSTSTASGKSIIYQVPLLTLLEGDPGATAIFVYPTKALAQDQKIALEQLMLSCPILSHLKVATYDGDTPQEARPAIRETASVIFTNFDTLHASILPHEDTWRRFLKTVRLFVVDELHYYTGLFGSHVALIIRRFRRVCTAVGNRRVQFISCTATLASPKGHMEKMFNLGQDEVVVIDNDGAPTSCKDFLIWNPPLIDPMEPSLGRYSSISEATGLMRFLMKRGVRVILFCKIRKICELAMKTISADLGNEGRHDILERVKPYRGGYSREDRRRIEHDAFSGRLLGIVATNALELGIDIGVLDAVVMLGFPMTIPSFRQQAGRAGRRSRDSLVILVTDLFAVDQYYANHPQELFNKKLDEIVVDVDSKIVLEAHLQCAGHEMPISKSDERWFGHFMQEICETRLVKDEDGWYHTHPNMLPYPARNVSIRGVQEEKYLVVEMAEDTNELKNVEEIEVSRAMFEVYEGGIFIHQGSTFIIKEISHDYRLAKATRADVNYITSPRDFTNVDALRTHRIRSAHVCRAYYGEVNVHVKVFGFFKIRNRTILDAVDLDSPPWERETTGFWIDLPPLLLQRLRSLGINLAEAIHSAQHAFLIQFPLSEDVKTECKAAEKEYKVTESSRKRPARLIFYDAIGKGGGVSVKAFENVQAIIEEAFMAITGCGCDGGCTKCIQSLACREANRVSSKLGAEIILGGIIGHVVDKTTPQKLERCHALDTIIEAPMVMEADNVQIEDM